ncbi:galactose-specific lectin nattectin-like [Vanacampus margaritifer]
MALVNHLLLLLCVMSGLFTKTWTYTMYRDHYCPTGWTRLNSRCLLYVDEALIFSRAEVVCNLLGGNLVSIHNTLENEVVQHLILLRAGSLRRSWIGLHDTVQDGDFTWTDGSPFDFEDWATNRPRVDTNQDCAVINFNGGFWNDIPCNTQRRFVCEKYLKRH